MFVVGALQTLIFLSQFGLGVMIGVPSGLTGKYWLDRINAVSAGVSWSIVDESFFAFVDWNYEIRIDIDIAEIKDVGHVFFYPGVGIFTGIGKRGNVGVKIPLGADFSFIKVPLNLFLEISPAVGLIPETSPKLFGFIGARYLFK